jgi:ATP-dependent RNA helicase DeaD
VEVGNAQGIRPGNLVGAIANEAGLEARLIGRIAIFDTYSLVELPANLPRRMLKHLESVQVGGRTLRIREGGPMPPQRAAASARGAGARAGKAPAHARPRAAASGPRPPKPHMPYRPPGPPQSPKSPKSPKKKRPV